MFHLIELILNWNALIDIDTISTDLIDKAMILDSYNLYQYSQFNKAWWYTKGNEWFWVDQTMQKELNEYVKPLIIRRWIERIKTVQSEHHLLHV